MQGSTSTPPLDVPYFQQTRTATCGPACLMMVMKYYDSSFEFSRQMEFRLWRKSYSLFLFGGTFQFGLATAAKSSGFSPEIYQTVRFSDGYPHAPGVADLVERIVSHHARSLNIPIHLGKENLEVIREVLSESIPPIVFINLQPILGENVFHWVVATGIDEWNVYVNDPYVPKGFGNAQKKNHPVPLDVFSSAMETHKGRHLRFPPCVVLVKP